MWPWLLSETFILFFFFWMIDLVNIKCSIYYLLCIINARQEWLFWSILYSLPTYASRWSKTWSFWTAWPAKLVQWFLNRKGRDKGKKITVVFLLTVPLENFKKVETEILCRWGLCQSNPKYQPKSVTRKENRVKIIRAFGFVTKSG